MHIYIRCFGPLSRTSGSWSGLVLNFLSFYILGHVLGFTQQYQIIPVAGKEVILL